MKSKERLTRKLIVKHALSKVFFMYADLEL